MNQVMKTKLGKERNIKSSGDELLSGTKQSPSRALHELEF